MIFEFREWLHSKKLVLWIVTVGLLSDNIFNTMTVPILPKIFSEFENSSDQNTSLTKTSVLGTSMLKGYTIFIKEATKENIALMDKSLLIGITIAAKSITQIIFNPINGYLTYEFGYSIPFYFGLLILFFATFLLAIATSFKVLLLSRILQGIASSCIRVAGFGILLRKYVGSDERRKPMQVSSGGMACGLLIGPLIAGFAYDQTGKTPMYLVLCGIIFISSFIQLSMVEPDVNMKLTRDDILSVRKLMTDPHILVITSAIFVENTAFAIIEATLPLWMTSILDATSWQLGVIFVSCNITYLISIYVILPTKPFCIMEKWFKPMIGILLLGFTSLLIPSAHTFKNLIFPTAAMGFAKSLVDSALIPELAHLMDTKYNVMFTYGHVYAISDTAVCLAYIIGSVLGGIIMKTLGFSWLILIVTIMCSIFSPMLFFLRQTSLVTPEQESLVRESCSRKYSFQDVEVG